MLALGGRREPAIEKHAGDTESEHDDCDLKRLTIHRCIRLRVVGIIAVVRPPGESAAALPPILDVSLPVVVPSAKDGFIESDLPPVSVQFPDKLLKSLVEHVPIGEEHL